jgi:hypothetical protein
MVLLVDRSDHEMIWLPDGDEAPDQEKHMIQSPKLVSKCVRNPDGFQVVDAMSKGEMFTAAHHIRNIVTVIVARRGETRKEVGPGCGQCKAPSSKTDKSVLR